MCMIHSRQNIMLIITVCTINGLHAAFGLLDDLSRDDHSLDLGCAFVYLVDLGVSHQFFNWIFRVESVTSEDLDGV